MRASGWFATLFFQKAMGREKMMTVMKQYQQRVRASMGSPAVSRDTVPTMTRSQQRGNLLDVSIAEDLKSLKEIRSIERKKQIKRDQLIPKYKEYVEQLQKDNQSHPLLTQYLVWLFDAGDIDGALELFSYCHDKELALPERFRRPLGIYVADEVLIWSERMVDMDKTPNPYFNDLFSEIATCAIDVPDELRAKYCKLAGLIELNLNQNFELAIEYFEHALELGALVKTVLNKAKKKLKKATGCLKAPCPTPGGCNVTDHHWTVLQWVVRPQLKTITSKGISHELFRKSKTNH